MEPQENDRHQQKNMGYLMIIAMWALIFALLAFLFQGALEKQYNPNQRHSNISTNSVNEVVLQRNHYGHYITSGLINNHAVTFMLDTGASDVSIPANLAKIIGLKPGRKMYYQTANGRIAVFATRIDRISIGNIELTNIKASINPHGDDIGVLLGMSFLKKVEFSQRGNTLTLRQHAP
jgi:aspartyl protease family protein